MYAVISRNNCVWCDRVREYLKEHTGKEVFQYKIDEHPILLDFVKAAGFKTVPVVFHNGVLIGGMEDTRDYIGV
jgi:glutaredoxin